MSPAHDTTPMQSGMVFESLVDARPGLNLEQIVIRMEATREAEFRNAWFEAWSRHPGLRMSFEVDHNSPRVLQHPRSADRSTFDSIFRSAPFSNDSELCAAIDADRQAGVDLSAPMRFCFFSPAEPGSRGAFVWTFHHAVLDGRGFTQVLEEVFDSYDEVPLGARVPSIGSDIEVLRTHLDAVEASLDTGNAFFKKHLVREAGTNFFLAATNKASTTKPHEELETRIDSKTLGHLEKLATETGASLYAVVLAAFSALLTRHTDSASASGVVRFGTTRACRYTSEAARHLPSCLINTVPFQVEVTQAMSVVSLIKQIHRHSRDLRNAEHVPLSTLPSFATDLSANVVFENYYLESRMCRRGPAWKNRNLRVIEEGSFPLTLAVYRDAGYEADSAELIVRFEYAPEHYCRTQIERLIAQLVVVFEHFVGLQGSQSSDAVAKTNKENTGAFDAPLPKAEVELLRELSTGGQKRVQELAPDVSYREALDAQLDKLSESSDAIIDSLGNHLSFAELTAQTTALRGELQKRGIQKNDRVGVCFPRDPSRLISMLTLFEMGVTFVPLDPTYPEERLRYIADDADLSLCIAHHSLEDRMSRVLARDVLVLDFTQLRPQEETPAVHVDPETAAYVIYTSGSTGTPKGVIVSHRAMLSHSRAIKAAFELSPEDRCLHFASANFDVSLEEILPTWLAGASVVLRDEDMSASIPHFLKRITAQRVTVLNLPTAFWHELARALTTDPNLQLPPHVRLVVIGGERASPAALELWHEAMKSDSKPRLINAYGPTEATITCTLSDLTEHTPVPGLELPIGQATDNAFTQVLDSAGRLTPLGAPGRLYIGGRGLADGYLGRAEETKARFVEVEGLALPPWSQTPARLYSTGDRVHFDAHGELRFLGREDRQVQIRGHRIELGEIEEALRHDDDVIDAVVALREVGGQAKLVAWVLCDASTEQQTANIRQRLTHRLPSYMIPLLVAVTEFPRAPGGKLDRDALPLPAENVERDEDSREVSLLEASVQRAFEGALGQKVSLNANFWEVGGHSLLALRLLSELTPLLKDGLDPAPRATSEANQETSSRRLRFIDLRQHPTPRAMAALIEGRNTGSARSYAFLEVLQKGTDENADRIYAMHVLGPGGIYYRDLQQTLSNRTFIGVSRSLDDNISAEVEAVAAAYAEEIVRNLESTSHRETRRVFLTAVSLGGVVAYETARILTAQGFSPHLLLFDALGPGFQFVGRSTRLKRHIKELMRSPNSYLKRKIEERIVTTKDAVARLRVKIGAHLGIAPDAVRAMDFVDESIAAAERYTFPHHAGPLTIFRATEDVFYPSSVIDSALGWRDVAPKATVIDVPGAHLSMLSKPNVASLARAIEAVIDKANSGPA